MNIVDFILRRVLGQLVNRGVRAGLNRLGSGTTKTKAKPRATAIPAANQNRQKVKLARQAAKPRR